MATCLELVSISDLLPALCLNKIRDRAPRRMAAAAAEIFAEGCFELCVCCWQHKEPLQQHLAPAL
jgi:hypothetical protein